MKKYNFYIRKLKAVDFKEVLTSLKHFDKEIIVEYSDGTKLLEKNNKFTVLKSGTSPITTRTLLNRAESKTTKVQVFYSYKAEDYDIFYQDTSKAGIDITLVTKYKDLSEEEAKDIVSEKLGIKKETLQTFPESEFLS